MSMSKDEFNLKIAEIQLRLGPSLKENIELKLSSQLEILKATGKTGDDLLIEMLTYASFDAVNRALIIVFSEVWELDSD